MICRYLFGRARRARATVTPSPESARRTAESVTLYVGRLTRQGMGGVSYAEIPGLITDNSVAVTSWTTDPATSGTSGDWTRDLTPGFSPVPSAHGSTDEASYTFPVRVLFADAVEEAITLTIQTRADTYTISSSAEIGTLRTQVNSSGLSGKRVELQTGGDFDSTTSRFSIWAPASLCTIAPAEPAKRPKVTFLWVDASSNLLFEDIESGGPVLTDLAQCNARIRLDTPNDMRFNRTYYRGDRADLDTSTGGTFKRDLFRIAAGGTNCIIENSDVQNCFNFITVHQASLSAITSRDNRVRYYHDNCCIIGGTVAQGGAGSSLLSQRNVFMSPRRRPFDGTHLDPFQLQQNAENCIITVEEDCYLQADGDAGSQAFWVGWGVNCTYSMRNVLAFVRLGNGICPGGATNSDFRNITLLKSSTGAVSGSPPPGELTADQESVNGPTFRFNGDAHTGVNTVRRMIVQDGFNNDTGDGPLDGVPSTWTATDIIDLGGNAGPGVMPVGTPANLFELTNVHAPLDALEAAGWTATFDEIVSAYKQAARPKVDGAAKRADGSYIGALNPDGSWATDAAYVP
jgi:hypothetical protein